MKIPKPSPFHVLKSALPQEQALDGTPSLTGRVDRALSCSFLSTACSDERIPLLQYTATLRNDGHPRRTRQRQDAGAEARRYTGRQKLPAFPTQTVGTQNPRKAAATCARPAVSRRCRDRFRRGDTQPKRKTAYLQNRSALHEERGEDGGVPTESGSGGVHRTPRIGDKFRVALQNPRERPQTYKAGLRYMKRGAKMAA